MNNYSLSTQLKKGLLQLIGRSILPAFQTVGEQNIIYCYHSVSDDNWLYTTNPAEFESQIITLMRHKQVVDLPTFLNGSIAGKTNLVTITFDDGYEDVFSQALPILEQYNIKATVFITGIRESTSPTQLNEHKQLLSLEQILRLQQKGWTIGYHTWSHPDLRNSTPEELFFQIYTGKRQLEEQLGFPLYYFAYPNGIYNKNIVQTVKIAGFHAGFTVNGGQVKGTDDPLLLSRVMIDNSINTLFEFKTLLNSVGLFINHQLTRMVHSFDGLKSLLNFS